MDRPPSFGEWLKQRRQALDLTQAELAQQVGCAEVTLRKLEAGVQRSSKQMAARLAEALNIAPAEQLAFVRFARGETAPNTFGAEPAQVSHPGWHVSPRVANLPTQPTPLIGRAPEMAAVRKRMLHDNQRLVTLLGSPGVGKTRLAMEAAGEMAMHFGDGVCFVPLAAVADPDLAPLVVCESLGLQESGMSAINRLKLYLTEKHILLVLDNFEHLLPAAPFVAELLEACPWLHILATSRAPLRVRAERQFPVPPLALPDLARLPDQEELERCAAIALFVERAQAVQPDFVLTPNNAATVAAICTHLDGLPLAIELVAARVKVLAPSTLLARLRGRLLLSSDGLRDVTPRHRTLRQAIDWSYALLTPAEQTLLMQLGVFAGGCTLEAAEAMCGAADGQDIVDGLTSLVDKSLIYQEAGRDGTQRFMMLETIHEYALERLAASGDRWRVQLRHAETFLQLAEDAEPHLRGAEQLLWFQHLEAEHDNLRAALAWCVGEEGDPLLGLRLSNALGWFWYIRAHYNEGSRWLDAALTRAGETAPALLRAWALYHAALLAVGLDDFALGRTMGEAALALARMLDDQRLIACLYRVLALHILCQGDSERAKMLWAEGLAIARAVNDDWILTLHLIDKISFAYNYDSDPVVATAWGVEVLPFVRNVGDRCLLGQWLSRLGATALMSKEPMQAGSLLEEALGLARQVEDRRELTFILEDLGQLAYIQDNYAQAATYYAEMSEIARQVGTPGIVAEAFLRIGRLAQKQGEPMEALAYYRQGLLLVKELNHHLFVAWCLTMMATLAGAPDPPLDAVQSMRLLGAADAIFGLERLPISLDMAVDCPRTITAARARLDDPLFAAAWAEGGAMSLNEAIAYALSCGEPEAVQRISPTP